MFEGVSDVRELEGGEVTEVDDPGGGGGGGGTPVEPEDAEGLRVVAPVGVGEVIVIEGEIAEVGGTPEPLHKFRAPLLPFPVALQAGGVEVADEEADRGAQLAVVFAPPPKDATMAVSVRA